MDPFDQFANTHRAEENIRAIQNSFPEAATAITKMTNGFNQTFRRFSEQITRTLEEHKTNIKTGWWYPNFIVDDLPSAQINEALKSEAAENTFTRLIIKECRKNDQKQLRLMHERWKTYDFLPKNRRRILLDALDAHMHRKYTLSIPVTLAQIEHFHHNLFPKKKEREIKYKGKNMDQVIGEQQLNFARQFGLDDHGKIPADYYFQLYPIYYYFENVLFANESLRKLQKNDRLELYKMSNPNNRHAILHGEKATYPSERRSLKQILFLDKLLFEISKLIEEDRL